MRPPTWTSARKARATRWESAATVSAACGCSNSAGCWGIAAGGRPEKARCVCKCTLRTRLCCIPVSRFYRDRGVFEHLGHDVLPALAASAVAAGRCELACWSACCASGEEPYTLSILWHLRLRQKFPALRLRLLATDIDSHLLERARSGCYRASSLKELPPDLVARAFARQGEQLCIHEDYRAVDFLQQDIREGVPQGDFDPCAKAARRFLPKRARRSRNNA